MPASYLGPVTVGETAGGLSAAYLVLRDALADLRGAAGAATAAMAACAACVNSQLVLLAAAQVDIGAQALPAPSAQVTGSLEAVAQLSQALLNPVGYFQSLLVGCLQAQASITADLALPLPALAAQLAAAGSISVELDLGLSALTASISALTAIELGTSECVLALLVAAEALTAAVNAATTAVAAADNVLAQCDVAGAQSFVFAGSLSDLGSQLDLVTPLSGVAGGTPVRAVVSFVQSSNGAAMAAQAALLKVS